MKKKSEFDIIIEPGRAEINYWKDLWRFRELFYILAWRDIKVRYKQTVLGFAWAILRPLLTMMIFTIVFNKIAKLPTEGTAPYSIMVFAATLPWQFFSNALSESSGSIIGNANLITKVYFPRLIIPASSVIVSLVDFIISFVILVGLFLWYRFVPSWQIIFLPFFIIVVFFVTFGFGLLISSLNVKYRDFRYIVPFIIQFGLFISPVGFSSNVIPGKWRFLYSLNPLVGIIDGFRWSIIGSSSNIYLPALIASIILTFLITFFALKHFRNTEKSFADII